MRRLRFVKQAQAAGFTLEEVGQLLALDAGHNRSAARELAKKKLEQLDAGIGELNRAREALRKLVSNAQRTRPGRVRSWLPLKFKLGSGRPRRLQCPQFLAASALTQAVSV